MNTPSSRQGNLTRYIVYLVLYLIVIGVKKLALLNDHVNKIGYFFSYFVPCLLYIFIFVNLIENNDFLKKGLQCLYWQIMDL